MVGAQQVAASTRRAEHGKRDALSVTKMYELAEATRTDTTIADETTNRHDNVKTHKNQRSRIDWLHAFKDLTVLSLGQNQHKTQRSGVDVITRYPEVPCDLDRHEIDHKYTVALQVTRLSMGNIVCRHNTWSQR